MRYHCLARLAFCVCLLGILGGQPYGSIASAASDEDTIALVRHLQELTGMSKGVCSILGCNDGRLPLAMARSSDFFVFVQDPRPATVIAARKVVRG